MIFSIILIKSQTRRIKPLIEIILARVVLNFILLIDVFTVEDSKPFTIQELTNHLDKNVPSLTEEDHAEVLLKMKHINLDVENIVARAKDDLNSNKENLLSSGLDLQSFHLRKNAVNCFIIKEMNLSQHQFFQDNSTIPKFYSPYLLV